MVRPSGEDSCVSNHAMKAYWWWKHSATYSWPGTRRGGWSASHFSLP